VPGVDSPSGVKLPGKDGLHPSDSLDEFTSRPESISSSKNEQLLLGSVRSSKSGGALCVQYAMIYRNEWSGLILLKSDLPTLATKMIRSPQATRGPISAKWSRAMRVREV
jgi:hypothetical protein